ncbi:MAG: hypothetical protein ACRCXT_00705 [Paraclostridium sp.]
MSVMDMINSVGFPIFVCLYLVKTNEKILNTIDKRLEKIEIEISLIKGENING